MVSRFQRAGQRLCCEWRAGSVHRIQPAHWNIIVSRLLCLRLASVRRLRVPRGGAVALLEAGAAAGVAALEERRREIVAATIAANQLFHRRCHAPRARRPSRCLPGFRRRCNFRLVSDDLFLGRRCRSIRHERACATSDPPATRAGRSSCREFALRLHMKSPLRV